MEEIGEATAPGGVPPGANFRLYPPRSRNKASSVGS